MPRALVDPDHPHVVFVASALDVPRAPKGADDMPSILFVEGRPGDVSPAELAALETAGARLTEWFDAAVGGTRIDANAAFLTGIGEGLWHVRKLSWASGRTFRTLDDALGFVLREGYGIEDPSPGPAPSA